MMYKDLGRDRFAMVLIRGDFEVNEVKLKMPWMRLQLIWQVMKK